MIVIDFQILETNNNPISAPWKTEKALSYPFPHHGNVKPTIEELLLEGWKPRIKKVKGRRYITAWKGNKERSFGPYTNELWEKVKPADPWATPSQLSELEKRISKLEKTQRAHAQAGKATGINDDSIEELIIEERIAKQLARAQLIQSLSKV